MNYTVSYGDNLWNIVKEKYNCNSNAEIAELVKEIAEENSLKNGGNSIFVNQKLNLPDNERLIAAPEETGEVSYIDSVTSEYQNALQDLKEGMPDENDSALKKKYEFNGKEYKCIASQNELDDLVKKAANGGAGTKYNHPDKCLSIAETYGLWATGDSNRAYGDPGVWGYGDAYAYKVYNSDEKENVLSEVKKELDAGRPCILHVNGSSEHSRHYVTVVGYDSSAGDNLQESDLLLWDSYDSSLCDCGSPGGRHMITGYATGRKGNEGYGWQIYERKAA